MTKNFSAIRPPDFHHGEETDMVVHPITAQHAHLEEVKVLPGETLGDLSKRLYGSNDETNRRRILANNPTIHKKVRVPRGR